ncbi:MAG: hypothetical protein DHS20C18_34670 [Saprospiraceae bacterium]|nr:MAG: hypothetical protein DHS20C18_34670 [Saprospiraceae bacterium]
MTQLFARLFEVRIWHDYLFLENSIPEHIPAEYKANELINIVPSKRTRDILKAYNLIYKPTQAGFLIVSRIQEGEFNQTFTQFDERIKLTFYIQIKHPSFSIFTNQSLQNFTNQLFYFDNLEANTIDINGRSHHFISNPIPGFNADHIYNMGDLVREQNDVFEVIDIPIIEAPISNVVQDTWAQAKNTQYITNSDRVPYGAGVFRFNGPNQNPGQEALFSVKNQFGENIELGLQNIPGEEIPSEKAVYPNDPEVNLKHSLFFGGKTEALYSIFLNNEDLGPFYVLPARENITPLGVIELFHTPPTENEDIPAVPAHFGFIDIGPDPENPLSIPRGIVYNLHFKSRMTFRRFISSSQVNIYDRPLPLSRAFAGVIINGKKMPDPDVLDIQREVDVVDNQTRERYFSNVYI